MARLSAQGPESPSAASQQSSDAGDESSPPFFNTTFSVHRVSPLYVGPRGLTDSQLEAVAYRLRDTLVGDVVRGIQVGLESTETSMGQVGPLKAVRALWFRASTFLGDQDSQDESRMHIDDESDVVDHQKRGLWIDIRHEKAAYAAILLPGLSKAGQNQTAQHQNFVHLPLLLLRMPLPLKTVVADWLSTTFDCRVSRVTLGTRTILGVWESWIASTGLSNQGPDFVVTLAFNAPLPAGDAITQDPDDQTLESGLRSVDITISPQDVRRFALAGTNMSTDRNTSNSWKGDVRERRRLAGGNADDGWEWLSDKNGTAHPFTDALGEYLKHHLSLNLFHPSVHVTQITCAGFVLGQGRLKILKLGDMSRKLSHAAWTFVAQLGDRVQGEEIPTIFASQSGT